MLIHWNVDLPDSCLPISAYRCEGTLEYWKWKGRGGGAMGNEVLAQCFLLLISYYEPFLFYLSSTQEPGWKSYNK